MQRGYLPTIKPQAGSKTAALFSGSFGRLNKSLQLRVVLLARHGFYTARHIHGVRTHTAHGLGNVLGSKSASEKNGTTEILRFERQIPIECFACAAKAFRRVRIKQPSIGFILRDRK